MIILLSVWKVADFSYLLKELLQVAGNKRYAFEYTLSYNKTKLFRTLFDYHCNNRYG